jgi:hypothetical protein
LKVLKTDEGTANEQIHVVDLHGDMGEDMSVHLIQQPDGDVILSLYPSSGPERAYAVEFCTSNGGGRHPIVAKKLRELIQELGTQ